MKINILPVVLCALVGSLLVTDLCAMPLQDAKLEFPKASPPATLTERVGLTDVQVVYARPGVKGRKIFGELVPYGEVWRTGANSATKISFGTDVAFGGVAVPAGSYALFTIPGMDEWTVILNKVEGQWGSYAYDEKNDLVRIKVKPVALPESVETMSIGLTDVRDESATLNIVWDRTRVPITLETDVVGVVLPRIEAAMAGTGKKPWLESAMFYYEHDLDLKQAVAWLDEAIKEQPEAMWIIYRKGLILAKLGDKQAALAAANEALALARKAGGALGAEYAHLSEALIASLR